MSKTYSEKDIERFAGLAGIRKKPTPYIGPTDSSGLWTIWREPGDNGVDRALAGANDLVHLIADSETNKYWVIDNGDGIPVGMKTFEDERGRKEKLSTFYVVTGLTHGGANFSGDKISRGTHGIGIKATNAMSTYFKVWTYRDSQWWAIEYASGKIVKEVHKCKGPPKLPHGLKTKRGTVVCFKPELPMFAKSAKMQIEDIMSWCKLTSYLVAKLTVKFTNSKGKTITLKTNGPAEYVKEELERFKATQTGKTFLHTSKYADIAVGFTDAEGADLVNAFTNGLKNSLGGEHTRALYDALAKSLEPYKGKLKYTPSDLRDGLIGLVNYKISAPQFNNQPKDKLVDERVYPIAIKEFTAAWSGFWKSNKSLAKQIVTRASELRKKTSSFLNDKKLLKSVKKAQSGLNAKMAGVVGKCPPEKRELFLVEGDSAAGGAKRARDKSFQAIYPLRGKPLNVLSAKKEKISNNAEVVGLLAALGIDLSKPENPKSYSYGKIILLADPDVDGKHINVLLLGILWKYVPHLLRNGCVYTVKAPLYRCRHKSGVYFGMTKEEVYKKVGSRNVDITYLKGWGEFNETELGVALNPKERQLFQITYSDKKGNAEFQDLLGEKPAYRKQFFGVAA